MLNKKYCVIGTGYIGLPCAVMLAHAGCKVLGYDVNKHVVDSINKGTIHVEQELKNLLESDTVKNNLRVSTVIEAADIFIVAVPTPIDHRKKTAELSALIKSVGSILSVLKKGDLIIIESTIPPLTIKNLISPMLEKAGFNLGKDVFLAHCPERLLPGNIIYEIVNNNRIIGGIDPISAEMAAEVYKLFVKGQINITDATTAEMCKLMENTYRDVNIALANELSDVCDDIGINIDEAIDLANLHPRVNFLKPGIGVGGHCLPIDPWFIHEISPYHSTMIMTARHINDNRPEKIAAKIRREISTDITQKILLLGKTYKTETNDVRESPAMEIYNLLLNDGYSVYSFDTEVDEGQLLRQYLRECSFVFILVPHKKMIEELYIIVNEMKKNSCKVPKIIKY